MIKIICKNSICEAPFYFDEQRYPNATEVKCPKCKNIQPIKAKPLPVPHDFSWLKPDLTPPQTHEEDFFGVKPPQEKPKLPVPVEIPRPPIDYEEDFFGRKPVQKEPTPPQEKPKPPVPVEIPRPPIDYEEDFFGQRPVQKEPNPPQIQPILSLIVGDWIAQRTFSLKSGRNFMGRRADNDIVLDQDEHISRRHAVLEVVAMPNGNWRYLVYDIGNLGETQSKNGVYVGSRRLNTMEQLNLTSGNIFQLGDTKFKLK
jgi:FHA domain